MPHTHDALFKSIFCDPHHAAGALRAALPAALGARIAWTTLAIVAGSFVDQALRDRHTDLLFTAIVDGRRALIYLLYEHQSRPHPLMPFRLVAYQVRIWEDWLRQNPEATRLPMIVAVVLHHGEGGWTAARTLEELYDVDGDTLAAAGEHVPRLRFLLDDLDAVSDEALRARAMSALGRLVLYAFRHARDPVALIRGLRACLGLISEVRAAPNGMAALATVWRYILLIHTGERAEEVLRQIAAATHDESSQEDIVTAGEELMERGAIRAERRTLLKQLRLRFGAVPEAVVTRLNDADEARLDAWLERVVTAMTLDEIFAA